MFRKYVCRYISCTIFIAVLCISCAPTILPQVKVAKEAWEQGNLELAYRYYEEALSVAPQNQEAQEGIRQLQIEFSKRGIAEAQQIVASAPAPSIPLLQKALARLNEYQRYDPQGTLLGPTLKEYQGMLDRLETEVDTLTQQVRAALAAGQFANARESIESIRLRHPQSPVLPALEDEYEDKYEQVRQQQLLAFQADIQNMIAQNRYYKAYLAFLESDFKDQFPDMLQDIQLKGSTFYLQKAQNYFQRGNVSRAYLEAVKGYELDPQLPELFEIYRDTRDEILKKLQVYIAISAFGAPDGKPDLGPQFSDALISYLFRTLPYGINIVEREKIDLLMKEHKREFEVLGDILNVNMIVTGNVSLMNIDKQNAQNVTTVRVQTGEKKEANPEYDLILKTHKNLEKVTLPNPVITIPLYETYNYTHGKTTIKGFATVSVRIFDVQQGSIIYAQEFNANYEKSDTYQDAVAPANIQGDLLELPTDTEVMENLRNSIIEQLAAVIQQHFEKREGSFLKDAQYFLVRKEVPKAIDALAAGFLYCTKAGIGKESSAFQTIRDLIIEHTEGGS